jgi:hypothetical protein
MRVSFSTWRAGIVVAGLSLIAVSPEAAVSSSVAIADAFVTTGQNGSLANNNYGGDGILSVAALGSPQGEFQSILKFDLAPTVASFDATYGAGQWSIESVSLQLTASTAGNAMFNPPSAGLLRFVWMANDFWVEGTGQPATPGATGITYNSMQTTISIRDDNLGTFSYDGGTSGNYTFALAPDAPGFNSDIREGGPVSILILGGINDNSVAGIFNSRSFATAASRPVLTVQAVPEPGMLGLVGLGVVVISGSIWRGRRTRS